MGIFLQFPKIAESFREKESGYDDNLRNK